jgi:hypothetical protein
MKVRRIAAALLAVLILCAVLAGCGGKGKLKGTYRAEAFGTGAAFTFSGDKVTVDVLVLGTVVDTLKGTYAIEDGKITLTFDSGEEEDIAEYGGTFDFEQSENAIKIGLIEYKKTES